MKTQQIALRHVCKARQHEPLGFLYPNLTRSFHVSLAQNARLGLMNRLLGRKESKSSAPSQSPSTNVADVRTRVKDAARAAEKAQQEELVQGSLAESSIWDVVPNTPKGTQQRPRSEGRNQQNMAFALNPRPNARRRWQRKMVIRHVRRRGRLTREMQIARTERTHVSKSHFFKTSMKKLAPLTRQIAGKTLDEAILQMRFSGKKVAQDVKEHLLQARHEAVTMKGMGFGADDQTAEDTLKRLSGDPSRTPALPHQTPIKTTKFGHTVDPTNIYISEAWINRGPYGRDLDYRAKGRAYMMRPPHTGISVVLKEEKTRTRQKAEKEARLLKKRLSGKKLWVQLPDRKVTTQRQHLLW